MPPERTIFLIADDDADDVALFREALQKAASATECHSVENGSELFRFLSDAHVPKPDVIFLDISMPVMNGWECLKRLKRSSDFRAIPTVMYSTSSARRDIDLAYQLGAALFLAKPEDFNELCSILGLIATDPANFPASRLQRFVSAKLP